MNRAALVMLRERGLIDAVSARQVAEALGRLDAPGGLDHKALAPRLAEVGGPVTGLLHLGRSRMDLGATSRRMVQRERLLLLIGTALLTRRALGRLARRHPDALLPAYTQGRYAIPVSWAHYLGGYACALREQTAALCQLFERINQSPLGAAAGGGSSLPIDRERLASLLGFDGVLAHTGWANDLSTITAGAQIAGVAQTLALVAGTFSADLGVQYAQARPWIRLDEAEGTLTSRSTSMPHKLNPSALHQLRQQASQLSAQAMAYGLRAHNTPLGHPDPKGDEPAEALSQATRLLRSWCALLPHLRLHQARARQEVGADFAATGYLVERLYADGQVPLHVAHRFAVALVERARETGWTPATVPHDAACALFTAVAEKAGVGRLPLPLDAPGLLRCLDASQVVSAATVPGGPQPAAVREMMNAEQQAIDADRRWLRQRHSALRHAAARLDQAFHALHAP